MFSSRSSFLTGFLKRGRVSFLRAGSLFTKWPSTLPPLLTCAVSFSIISRFLHDCSSPSQSSLLWIKNTYILFSTWLYTLYFYWICPSPEIRDFLVRLQAPHTALFQMPESPNSTILKGEWYLVNTSEFDLVCKSAVRAENSPERATYHTTCLLSGGKNGPSLTAGG